MYFVVVSLVNMLQSASNPTANFSSLGKETTEEQIRLKHMVEIAHSISLWCWLRIMFCTKKKDVWVTGKSALLSFFHSSTREWWPPIKHDVGKKKKHNSLLKRIVTRLDVVAFGSWCLLVSFMLLITVVIPCSMCAVSLCMLKCTICLAPHATAADQKCRQNNLQKGFETRSLAWMV